MSYAERALRTLSAGNRTLLRAQDEPSLLHDMCRAIVEIGGYRMAWVGYLQQDEEKTIAPMAHYGFEAGFLRLARFTWAEGPEDRGPTSKAVRSGKPAIVQDLRTLTGPALPVQPDETLRRGYASVAAFPLLIDGDVIGNLTIFAAEPDAFDERETELLDEMACDLAFGIAAMRARERQRQAEETIRRMAYFDALTGLPNHTSLLADLGTAIERAHLQHLPLAVLLVEIGRFEEISDTLGHREADALLLAIARRLQPLVGEYMLARVGESEFAFVRVGLGAEASTQLAAQLIRDLGEPVMLDDLTIDSHVRVGIALFPGHGTAAEELLRRAKLAAVQSRQTCETCGKYAVYKGTVDQQNRRRLTMMSDLRRAIGHNELRLYCQPKVNIASGQLFGAEALVRWEHPEHDDIVTGEFVALAERAGLIIPLTRWVLEAAFQQAHAWHEAGFDYPLSINLSAQDLRDPRLIDRIGGLFATWAMPPSLIQFELTESVLVEDPVMAQRTLAQLKEFGVSLFIDDFGTGYSSLSYLQALPVDALKIDQSFVASMQTNARAAVIVRSIIELGHGLGLAVVAEGVESEALWTSLRELGCDTAQGYFVSPPIPAEEFPRWVEQSHWQRAPLVGAGA